MAKPAYNDAKTPPYFIRESWLNSQLSIARFGGACTFNGARYEVDELTGDLCREDVATARRKAYSPEDLAVIKTKRMQKGGEPV